MRARGLGTRVRRAGARAERDRAGSCLCHGLRRACLARRRIQGRARSAREPHASGSGRKDDTRVVDEDGVDRRKRGSDSPMMEAMPVRIASYRRLLLALGVVFAGSELLVTFAFRGGPLSQSIAALLFAPFFAPALGGAFVILAWARPGP